MSDDDTIIARRSQSAAIAPSGMNALSLIELHEGRRYRPYKDVLGNWTTGVGHEIKHTDPGYVWGVLTDAQIDALFANDIHDTVIECEQYLWYKNLSEARAAAVLDMMYNLGPNKFAEFHHFIAAMQQNDWQTAHDQLLDSDAARELPKRYGELAKLILNEEWPV